MSGTSLVGILETKSQPSIDVSGTDCSIGEIFSGGLDLNKRRMSILSAVPK